MGLSVTLLQAREFLLKKHGLLGPTPFVGKEGLLSYVRQTGCVQYDPVDVCGKSHELAFLSRVQGFHRELLREALYEDRVLMDYWDKNMSLVLTEDWPYFEPRRQHYRQQTRSMQEVQKVKDTVLAHLERHGPTTSQQLPISGKVDWYWSETNLGRAALESLYFCGDLVIHHKQHTVRSYALAKDLLPPELLAAPCPLTDLADQQAWMALRRIGAVGLLWNRPSDAWLCIPEFTKPARDKAFARLEAEGAILPVQVEGFPIPFFIRSEDEPLLRSCQAPYKGKKKARFIAPLDCLLWDRKLVEALFSFSYKWEIYNPESKRRYSYYVLPVLYGNRFAGRVEPLCDRKKNTLVMKRFWAEPDFRLTPAFQAALEDTARQLADFHGLENLRFEDGFWHNTPRPDPFARGKKTPGQTAPEGKNGNE